MSPNLKAILDTIATSEGTINRGDNGYNVLVGAGLFNSYADHPRTLVDLPNLGIKSTAAGRYQILEHNYDVYKAQLNLPDFSPDSQDAIAIQLIKECHAMDDVETGRFGEVIRKCASRWASLPGAGYGQHENKLDKLQAAYLAAGGKLMEA